MADPMGDFPGFSLTSEEEEGLLALLRSRVEAKMHRRPGTTVAWTRPERAAERDDLRARAGLDRAAADRLPSARPWRGQVRSGRFFRRTRFGVSIGFIASWSAGVSPQKPFTRRLPACSGTGWSRRPGKTWRFFSGKMEAGIFTGAKASPIWPTFSFRGRRKKSSLQRVGKA